MNGDYQNGHGNHSTNGYRYDREAESHSRSRDRRYAGYNGMSPDSQDRGGDAPPPLRPAEIERRRANRLSGGRSGNSGRSRSQNNEGRAAKQIEDILQYLQHEWSFMTENNCIPVQVALQLLDWSSLGLARRSDEFKNTQERLQNALRAIVNEHHQGFNSSIGTFHQIQESIQASHDRVQTLRESLVDAKRSLTSTKAELRSLVTSSREFEETLEALDTIEKIQQMPEQVEASISEKRFLRAVDLLQEALRLVRAPNMEGIGALSDLKIYLSNQEHSLVDVLTEELHNHLYLKSAYCEDRWMSYAKLHGRNRNLDTLESNSRSMYGFLEKLDLSIPMEEDTSRNPEADSFYYIYMIVESLARLDRLEDAVDSLEQRLPIELFKVVERSNGEVQLRHPNALQTSFRQDKSTVDMDRDDKSREVVLDDLLGTLYAKFEAIAESHRVFHEVVTGVAKRDATWNPRLTRGFKELWKLYQSEIRSLLHDYLSSDGNSGQRLVGGIGGEENIFKQQRDKNKRTTFKMEWVDQTAAELKTEQDEVVSFWQKFVPGIGSLAENAKSSTNGTSNSSYESSALGHKLLVEPSVFNINCLLPPSVFFLKRLRELIPPGSDIVISTLSSFLNDFLINVYYPQLEETIMDQCAQSYAQLDAFQQDPSWFQHSQKPLFKGTVKFLELIVSYCKMLDDLTHDQLFTQLIITQMNNYYDRCGAWFKALLTRTQDKNSGRTMKIAAVFSEPGQIGDTIMSIWNSDDENVQEFAQREISQILHATDSSPLEESDLISDRKTQAALCLMYNSMKWLAFKLQQLRRISDRATDSAGMEVEEKPQLKRTLTTALNFDKSKDESIDVFLPLSERGAGIFDRIVDGFRELAVRILKTLHLELRCHIVQGLTASLKGSFQLSMPTDVPDEKILSLINDLLAFNQETSTNLQEKEYSFLTSGISQFLDAIILHTTTRNIMSMNIAGAQHMQLNVQVLNHNILNIESSGDLPRSTAFFKLFEQGPDAVISSNGKGFGGIIFPRKDLEILLKWWYSQAMESQNREEALRAQKQLDEKLKQIEANASNN